MINRVELDRIKRKEIYGSFLLGGSEFAISVKAIQEVVNEPSSYHSVPLAPEYLLGLFNLRGMIIPVVDLRKIFELPMDGEGEGKIAIIEHGNLCVGILFDRTCEVFTEGDVEKSQFRSDGGEQKERVIEGVFKFDEGERIVQILNPYELLNLKDVPQTDESVAKKVNLKKRGKREQCISFKVGASICALKIGCIQEIVKVKQVDNTVLSNEVCLGAINIRGNTIPVIDFEKILGYESQYEMKSSAISDFRIIIMKLEGELFGLLVKSVESIISFFEDEVVGFPVLNESKKEMFKGCIKSDGGDSQTILLDHSQVLSNSEIDRITKGHSLLYKEKTEKDLEERKRNISKRTYLTFTIGDSYALEINEVREVIEYPEEILNPPNLSTHFKGMINLRGDLIPLIDPRLLYGVEKTTVDGCKVLIFSAGNSFYALVVDSVDSIASFNDDEKVKLPELLYRKGEGSLNRDVKEAVQVTSGPLSEKTFLILDLNSISSRISTDKAA